MNSRQARMYEEDSEAIAFLKEKIEIENLQKWHRLTEFQTSLLVS